MSARIREVRLDEVREDELPPWVGVLDRGDGAGSRRAWVAVEDGRDGRDGRDGQIIAILAAQLHDLRIDDQTIAAARIIGLELAPELRGQAVDPELGAALRGALAEAGSTHVYRLGADITDGSALGLREVGRYAVRLAPLRPLSLVARRLATGSPAAVRLAAAGDRLARAPLQARARLAGRLPTGRSIVRLALPEDAEGIREVVGSAHVGGLARAVDPDALSERWRAPVAEGAAVFLGLIDHGELLAVLGVRLDSPQDGARLGAIVELAARDDDAAALAQLVLAAPRYLEPESLDGLLLLDALGPQLSSLATRAGYLDLGERRVLEVALDELADDDPARDAERWRLSLAASV